MLPSILLTLLCFYSFLLVPLLLCIQLTTMNHTIPESRYFQNLLLCSVLCCCSHRLRIFFAFFLLATVAAADEDDEDDEDDG